MAKHKWKLHGLVFLILLCATKPLFAISVVSFQDFDYSKIRFDNRIRMSPDLANPEFENATTVDSNNNGQIDSLESQSFSVKQEQLAFYLGNKSNGVDIARELLFVGIQGRFDSFTLQNLTVFFAQTVPISAPQVYSPFDDIESQLDRAILFEINQKIEDREPNDSPLGQNNPVSLLLSQIVSTDPDIRFFLAGIGGITSGELNSKTPKNSTILFLPVLEIPEETSPVEPETVPNLEPSVDPIDELGTGNAPVVPEPATWCLFLSGVAALLKRKEKK